MKGVRGGVRVTPEQRRTNEKARYLKNRQGHRDHYQQYSKTPEGRAAAARATAKYRAKRLLAIKAMISEIKAKGCMDCGGVFDPVCMDFDHRPGETKLFNVAAWKNFSANVTTAKLLAEIAKCDLVCANCHRVRTFKQRTHYDLVKKGEERDKSEPQLTLFVSNSNDDKDAA